MKRWAQMSVIDTNWDFYVDSFEPHEESDPFVCLDHVCQFYNGIFESSLVPAKQVCPLSGIGAAIRR